MYLFRGLNPYSLVLPATILFLSMAWPWKMGQGQMLVWYKGHGRDNHLTYVVKEVASKYI